MRTQLADWKDPDYAPIYRERLQRLRKVREDDGWAYLHAFYRTHPVEYIEDWLTTYDPRRVSEGTGAYMPFMLFPKQKEFVGWVVDRLNKKEEGVAEKSRDCGISWVCLGIAAWAWTFIPGCNISFGSRKEDLVDRLGDADSLFEKLRLTFRRMPPEMLPLGYVEDKHAPRLKITNPETGASITGEAGKNIGRGGRSTIYFIDEAAFIEHADEVERALSENTDCKIWVSTPNGMGNLFARKRHRGTLPVFTFFWRDDPRKDDEWYEKKKRTLEPETLSQEVDLDYEATGGDTVIPTAHVRASMWLYQKLAKDGKLPARDRPGVAGLDVGGGSAPSVLVIRRGPLIEMPFATMNDDSFDIAAWAVEHCVENNVSWLNYDAPGVGKGVQSGLKRAAANVKSLRIQGINTGVAPTRKRWPDGKRSKQKFSNLKGELWWMTRERLRKTYQHTLWMQGEGGLKHPIEELMILPNHPKFLTQLPIVGYDRLESGKIQIQTKKSLKRDGIASPDDADAVVLTEAPKKRPLAAKRTRGLG